MPSLDVDVAASYDDCRKYWNGSSWSFGRTSTYVAAGYNSATFNKAGSGMRWLNITIPKGAIISVAYLRLHASTSYAGTVVRSKIRGELSPNPVTFSNLADFDNRPRALTTVDWEDIPAWSSGTYYNSPEIKDIIQEIIDQGDWASGNTLVLFWDDFDDLSDHNANCRRYGGSWNSTTKEPPRLHIEYFIVPVSDIDVGAYPVNRDNVASSGWTRIDKANPANASGTLHSVKVWAANSITGLRVGTFYTTNGNTLKCRDSELIGDVVSGAERTFTGLSITVVEGDYIGCYFTGGSIDRHTLEYTGIWSVSGEFIDPNDETTYTPLVGDAISLYGYGDVEVPPGLENKSANMGSKLIAVGLI